MYNEIRGLRNHPTYIIETSWGALLILVMLVVNSGQQFLDLVKNFDATDQEMVRDLIILLSVFFLYNGLMVFLSFRQWKLTSLSIVDGSLTWEQNTIFAKKQEIAVSTISNVNLEQNIFERIVGTYKLKLDTSSLSTANKTDMKIILGEADAYKVRDLLLRLMHGEAAELMYTDEPTDMQNSDLEDAENRTINPYGYACEQEDFDIVLSGKENILSAIASLDGISVYFSFWMIVAGIGGAGILKLYGGSNGESIAFFVTFLFVAAGFIKKIITKALDCFHYKVRRKDNHIYITSGALKIRSYSVPVNQIQAFRLKKSLLGRLMHRTSVSIINVGGEKEDVDGQWILPAVLDTELPEMLSKILPEFQMTDGKEMVRRPYSVLIRKQIWNVLSKVVIVGLLHFLYFEYLCYEWDLADWSYNSALHIVIPVFGAIWMLWDGLQNHVEQRTEGLKISEESVSIRRGKLDWEQVQISYDKMQMMKLSQGPVMRVLHTRNGQVRVLASTIGCVQKLPEMSEAVMCLLRERFQATID